MNKSINYLEELIDQSSKLDPYLCFLKKHNKKKSFTTALNQFRRTMIKGITSRPQDYSFNFVGTKCNYLYSVYPSNDLGKSIIAVDIYIDSGITIEIFKQIIKKTSLINKKIKVIHLYLTIDSHVNKLAQTYNQKSVGFTMISLVKDSYNYLREFDYSKDVTLQKLERNEIEDAINLEFSAHTMSTTTRCSSLKRSAYKSLYEMGFKRKLPIFTVKEFGKIVGVIALSISKDGRGFIMTIAVDPNEQKRGISTLLYFHAMKYFKKKGIETYTGVSTTSEVLRSAKKMGRHVHSQYLEISY